MAFARDGYLLVPDALPRAELAALDAEFERQYRERLADPEIAADEQRRNQVHRLGTDSERSRELAADRRILSLVEDLVYPGIALFSAKLISKGPHEPRNVCHWHQDEASWHMLRRLRAAHVDLAAAAGHLSRQRLPARGARQPPAPHRPAPAAFIARPRRLPPELSTRASAN